MPRLFRPSDKIYIDWQDNAYDHAFADVTNDYQSYNVNYGCDLATSSNEIFFRSAVGSLKLSNLSGRYSPDSDNTDINKSFLLTPHKVRIFAVGERLPGITGVGTVRQAGETDALLSTRPSVILDGTTYVMNSNPRWRRTGASGTNRPGFRIGFTTEPSRAAWGGNAAVRVYNKTTGITVYYDIEDMIPGVPGIRAHANFDYLWPARGIRAYEYRPQNDDEVEIDFVYPYNLLWEGIAIPKITQSLSTLSYIDFDLRSHNHKEYRKKVYVFSEDQQDLESFIHAEVPVEVEFTPTLSEKIHTKKIGVALFENSLLRFLHAIGQFSHGWSYEDRYGRFGATSWNYALLATPEATLNHDVYRFLVQRNVGNVYDWIGLIKNKTIFHALPFRRSEVKRLGSVRVSPSNGRTQEVVFRYGGSAFYISDWHSPVVTTAGDASAITVTEPEGGKANRSHTVNVTFTDSISEDYSYLLWFYGREHTIDEFISKSFENTTSIEKYGEIEFNPPNWYPEDGSEFDRAVDFANRLSEPMKFVQLTCPRWAISKENSDTIDSVEVGNVYNIGLIDINNANHTYTVLILGIKLERRTFNTPRKTLYGLAIRDYAATSRWDISILDQDVFLYA